MQKINYSTFLLIMETLCTGADSHISGIVIFFLQLDLFLPESQLLSLQNLVGLIFHKTDDMQLCDISYNTDSMIFINRFSFFNM